MKWFNFKRFMLVATILNYTEKLGLYELTINASFNSIIDPLNMKLKFVFLLFIISFSYSAIAQMPTSYANFSAGLGPNFGILGVKSVVGYKNSGLLLGFGHTFSDGIWGYEIGGQFAYDHWFLNAGYGIYSTYDNYSNNVLVGHGALKGLIVSTGAMINVGKPKLAFIEIGGGLTFPGNQPEEKYYHGLKSQPVPVRVTFNVGVGYRIAKKKKPIIF
jgi:hypothetical protein